MQFIRISGRCFEKAGAFEVPQCAVDAPTSADDASTSADDAPTSADDEKKAATLARSLFLLNNERFLVALLKRGLIARIAVTRIAVISEERAAETDGPAFVAYECELCEVVCGFRIDGEPRRAAVC